MPSVPDPLSSERWVYATHPQRVDVEQPAGTNGFTLIAMGQPDIQFVSSEGGEPTAVIIPIALWRELESERETAYLLSSSTMKQRLIDAISREDSIPAEAAFEKLGI